MVGLIASVVGFVAQAAASPKGSGCSCQVRLSVSSGHRGSSVTVNGSGFRPNSKASIEFFGSAGREFTLATNVPVSSTGTFSRVVTIPKGTSPGHGRIRAVDRRDGNSAGFMVTVTCPTLASTDHAPTGSPGGHLEIRGKGFCPNSQVFIRLTGPGGATTLLVKGRRAGRDGRFDVTVKIPGHTQPGSARIRVTDPASSQAVTTSLQVVSSP
jgi:hypothetical protein